MKFSELSRLSCADAGILAAGKWFYLRAFAWTATLFIFAALIFVGSLRWDQWLTLPAAAAYWIGLLLPLAGLAVYGVAVRLGERRNATEISLRSAPRYLLLGALVGFAFMALSLVLLWVLGLNTIGRGHWQYGFHYFVFNAYVSGIVEELGFRAILMRIFARMFGPLAGLLISAVLFALAHAGHASALTVALLVVNGGLLLGVLYLISGSLWMAIGAHIAYDFAETSLFGVGDTDGYWVATPVAAHPVWLTGGATGPDGSVLSVLVSCALMMVVLFVARTWPRNDARPAARSLA